MSEMDILNLNNLILISVTSIALGYAYYTGKKIEADPSRTELFPRMILSGIIGLAGIIGGIILNIKL